MHTSMLWKTELDNSLFNFNVFHMHQWRGPKSRLTRGTLHTLALQIPFRWPTKTNKTAHLPQHIVREHALNRSEPQVDSVWKQIEKHATRKNRLKWEVDNVKMSENISENENKKTKSEKTLMFINLERLLCVEKKKAFVYQICGKTWCNAGCADSPRAE